MVLFTKGAHHDQNGPRVNPEAIRHDLMTSLERMRTDYIDLYALHRDDPATPVGVIVEALNEHLEAGRIRAFGGSNWTHQRFQEANDYAASMALLALASARLTSVSPSRTSHSGLAACRQMQRPALV